MRNLDLECAELGRRLADSGVKESDFVGALGVLEEQGPYACFLYLKVQKHEEVTKQAMKFLQQILGGSAQQQDPLEFMRSLASDLDHLLFAHALLRQAFVYARYHAKLMREGAGVKS